MNRKRSLLFGLIALIAGSAACAATSAASVQVQSRSVSAGKATSVRVDLKMHPGNLTVQGGASHLIDARFEYDPPAWKPAMSYSVAGARGHLTVTQRSLQSVNSRRNTWRVRLSNTIPLDLFITSGPGNATLSLRPLMLSTVTLTAGPGNVSIDAGSPVLKLLTISAGPGNLSLNLCAPWKHNVSATVNAGMGNTTLRIPAKIGTQVVVHGAGIVTAQGLTKQGSAYVNSSFGHSQSTLRASLSTGLGNVYLRTTG